MQQTLTPGFCCSLTAYWAGASPQTLFKWYTLKAVFLYGARFYLYRWDAEEQCCLASACLASACLAAASYSAGASLQLPWPAISCWRAFASPAADLQLCCRAKNWHYYMLVGAGWVPSTSCQPAARASLRGCASADACARPCLPTTVHMLSMLSCLPIAMPPVGPAGVLLLCQCVASP